MQLVVEIVTLPPLGIEAAVFEQRADGTDRLVASSDPCLEGLPVNCTDFVPWAGLCTEASAVEIDNLPDSAREQLLAAGFERCVHAGAHAPDVSTTLRLIACMRERRDPVMGAVQRVERARELMSVVLLKAHNDKLLARAATIDDLTGLPNRVGLSRYLDQVATGSDDCVMLFVDIDGFKLINDRHGHLVGDRVLATVADRLRRAVRAEDVVTRLYGDEFIVLLRGMTGDLTSDTVKRIAERVVSMLAEPLKIDGATLNISASVGVAHLGDDRNVDRWMSCADQAMYTAKRAGGGRHHIDPVHAA
jgi:diguanylate cyclase (GGDEF)-like protein